jgi:hypothetical protein
MRRIQLTSARVRTPVPRREEAGGAPIEDDTWLTGLAAALAPAGAGSFVV